MKPRILAEQRMLERGDQRFWRVTQDEVAGDQACRGADLLLSVERIVQSSTDLPDCNGQVVETVAALAW